MISDLATICNQLGLHARPAMSFVQMANGFACTVAVRRADSQEWVDGKSIMQMLLLAATAGTTVEIRCDGSDDQSALAALCELIARKFDEE